MAMVKRYRINAGEGRDTDPADAVEDPVGNWVAADDVEWLESVVESLEYELEIARESMSDLAKERDDECQAESARTNRSTEGLDLGKFCPSGHLPVSGVQGLHLLAMSELDKLIIDFLKFLDNNCGTADPSTRVYIEAPYAEYMRFESKILAELEKKNPDQSFIISS